eukprot:TRINITY_DN5611_c0_g1_i2.p1 TRINITY_DN5611_c0_g1~~TRINITY_DN5611_c0_g1_i2.p1  ORF type:complete len:132 (-),score=13.77 TRINITY_DN5611_c0_g1_i2:68-463(-)
MGKRLCSPDKCDIASHVLKIFHTSSTTKTFQSVDNIDDMIREPKKDRGQITEESLSKVVSTCIFIPEKKWSLLIKRFILSLVVTYDQFEIVAFINKVFTLDPPLISEFVAEIQKIEETTNIPFLAIFDEYV